MYNFCTYFDQNYLARGLALYRSLIENCEGAQLWVLCFDDATYRTLKELSLPGLHPIALEEFERGDEPLKTAKTNRSSIEYYFTCTPSLPLYILNHYPEVNLITYIDADLFFFSSIIPLFEEMAEASVAIIGHHSLPEIDEMYGLYNVGWLSFRRDTNGLACLKWWRDRCNEWCYDRVENGRFADQKYLDEWPTRFKNVVVLKHKGANLAPWNLNNYHLSYRNGNVMVDDQPLIFFHFCVLKRVTSWLYDPNWPSNIVPSAVLRELIYARYINAVSEASRKWLPSSAILPFSGYIRFAGNWFRLLASLCKKIMKGRYIFLKSETHLRRSHI